MFMLNICFNGVYRWHLWLLWGENRHVFCLAGILHHFYVISCCDRLCAMDAHRVRSGEARSCYILKQLKLPTDRLYCLIIVLRVSMCLCLGCFRRAVTSAAWCLHCSTWCGPPCFWSGGRGGGLSWRTSGEHWTHLLNLWRSHGLSSGWEKLKLRFLPSTFSVTSSSPSSSFMFFFSLHLSLLAGSQALQSHNRMWGILLPSMAKACIQVAGQPAHLYLLPLLCLPGHAHLLWVAGQSAVSICFFFSYIQHIWIE